MSPDDVWTFARLDTAAQEFEIGERVIDTLSDEAECHIRQFLPEAMCEVEYADIADGREERARVVEIPKAQLKKIAPGVSVWPSSDIKARQSALVRAIDRKFAREGMYGDDDPICDTFDPNITSSGDDADEGEEVDVDDQSDQ